MSSGEESNEFRRPVVTLAFFSVDRGRNKREIRGKHDQPAMLLSWYSSSLDTLTAPNNFPYTHSYYRPHARSWKGHLGSFFSNLH
ncbi:hypothetical protein N7471_004695 [Penicillium samsonianum]|uniref:uncharacterized protein n=1 Tax=Penicillium samsonianum TaxID=1882272 RepID=UPI0025470AF2|nr:uncharacterized protein N7471_004695 [Penicillium samsonianum]KAJ6138209.1 hypothetical protein N7471_004695 [Penicillium samsonianum]